MNKELYFDLREMTAKGFTDVKPKVNPMGFLKVNTCVHNDNKVITLVDWSGTKEEELCLHNGEYCTESEEKIAVDLFEKRNVGFFEYVDMFTSKERK